MRALFIHTRSVRVGAREVLVTQVLSEAGMPGFGVSFSLDATQARHMAEARVTALESSLPRPPGSSAATR